MSYDLNFFQKGTQTLTRSDIASFLVSLPNIIHNSDNQWLYENKDTGVYCSFNYYAASKESEDESYEGFVKTGFSFNINFIRTEFFAKEYFPIVSTITNELDLFISNPQKNGVPQKFDNEQLIQDWIKSNNTFAKAQFKQFGLHYLEAEKSHYAWTFNLNKQQLQTALTLEYFVPQIFYIKKNRFSSSTIVMCMARALSFRAT